MKIYIYEIIKIEINIIFKDHRERTKVLSEKIPVKFSY